MIFRISITNHYQRVCVDGIKTEYFPINRGVPQRTVFITTLVFYCSVGLNFTKTWKMTIHGNTRYPLPKPLTIITRKSW